MNTQTKNILLHAFLLAVLAMFVFGVYAQAKEAADLKDSDRCCIVWRSKSSGETGRGNCSQIKEAQIWVGNLIEKYGNIVDYRLECHRATLRLRRI